uniref:Uncharacterized protein n=1 Tax=Ditylenchus dipsaci TaxID=166011 RepID=A0A915E435_9BILA
MFIYHLLVVQYSWTRNGVKGFGKSLLGGMSSGEDQEDGGSSVHEEQYALSELNNHSVVEQEEAAKGGREFANKLEDFDAAQLPVQRITSEVLDRQKICMIVNGPNEKNTTMTAQGLQAFLYFGLYHCYVFALLAMMTWVCCITLYSDYSSWSSPVHSVLHRISVACSICFSMDLKQELSHEILYEIIGFIFAENRTESFITLCVKILLSLPLFVLLRLHLREDYYNSLSDNDRLKRLTYGTFDISASSSRSAALQRIQANRTGENGGEAFGFITHFFIKYWIFVVITFLLINCPLTDSLRVYLYSIGFFVFFAALIVSLHISFTFFRKTIYLFLTVLIVYASVVLISVYTYQFRDVADFIHNHTILNKNWTEDIGLIVFENSANDVTLLFKSLILPISLIVVTMLQLKFFHDPWTKLVQGSGNGQTHRVATSGVDGAMNRAKHQSREVIEVLWRLAEVHGYRLILFVLVLVAVSHFCALNFVIIVFVALAACLPSLSRMISLLLCLYMSTVFIARRIYQLHLTQNSGITEEGSINRILDGGSCEQSKNDTLPEFQCASKWIGFEETNDLQSDLKGLVLVIVLIGLQLCVRYRQKHRRTMLGVPEPAPGTIFSEATPLSFDANILSCFKCLLNYGFYKFGLEISMSAMVIVAWFRMDFLAGMLIVWLVCFVVMSRAGCRVVWPVFLIYLAVLFPLQYAMAIGLPSEWGIEYPWTHILTDVDLDNNLSVFLDLANYNLPAERFYIFIICDAILLLIVAAQELVFRQEGESHPAGSNESIYKDGGYLLHKENPRYDFVVEQKSFVDFFKMVVFMYGHWITMIMLMAAGLGGTSLFALGYLVLAFWMLWQGNNLYTMYNYGRTIYWWKVIAVYTVVVMFLKIFLQLFGCAFLYTEFFTGNDLRPSLNLQ